ncbi:hypothetical protein ADK67_26505 [Saccharothrix sp. NRRL B-16348]|nr:hypothetical protein ADK67_26505 [Saccharothrix sp. NRRL B-16348]
MGSGTGDTSNLISDAGHANVVQAGTIGSVVLQSDAVRPPVGLAGRALHLVGGRLPAVREIDLLALRVKPAIESSGDTDADLPPYVARDVDARLRETVLIGGMVLLHGRAAAGKSRTALEVLRAVLPDAPLLVPRDGQALRELAESGSVPERVVVWLDDLERFLRPGGFDLALLQRLCPSGAAPATRRTVVATMRDQELARYDHATGGDRDGASAMVDRQGVELIEQLRGRRRLHVAQVLSRAEHEGAARQATRDSRVARALVADEGFAEFLAAGVGMVRRWSTGDGPLFHVGQALISIAVDCRRAGLHGPIHTSILEALKPAYLPPVLRHRADLPPTHDALAWACERVLGASSCLQPRQDDCYVAADYLVDHAQRGGAPVGDAQVPDVTWLVLLKAASTAQAYDIGVAARSTERRDIAELAFRAAAAAGHTDAMFSLGALLVRTHGRDEMLRWWRAAAQAGDTMVMNNLGSFLEPAGELDEAEHWWRLAAATGHQVAMGNLGGLLSDRGDDEEAEHWLHAAGDEGLYNLARMKLARGDAEQGERYLREAALGGHSAAMMNLGVLLKDRGEGAEAERWWLRVVDGVGVRGIIEVARSLSMFNLGVVCEARGERERAEYWWRAAADCGDEQSMFNLALVALKRDDPVEAERWFLHAADEDFADAMFHLGALYRRRGDVVGAERWWRAAAGHGHPDAMVNLAHLAADDPDQVRYWYQAASEAGQVDAMFELASLHYGQDEVRSAEHWWLRAAEAGHGDAMYNVGALALNRGDLVQARHWYHRAAEARHLQAMAALSDVCDLEGDFAEAEQWRVTAATAGHVPSMTDLGVACLDREDETNARHWFRLAAEAGDTSAMSHLGVLLANQGELAEALHWWTTSAAGGDSVAMANLGVLAENGKDTTHARQWYRRAADLGHPGAMVRLGALAYREDDVAGAEHWWSLAAQEGDTTAAELLRELGERQ